MKHPKIPPKIERLRKKVTPDKRFFEEYLGNKEVNEFIEKMNKKYYPWDKFVYIDLPKEWDRDVIWLLMKFNRRANSKKLKVNSDSDFSFQFNLLEEMQEKLHEFDMNLGGSMGSSKIIPTEEKDRYLISSIMEESIASSQLEGAATTRKVAKEMLKSTRKPRDKNERMIVNNYVTARMIKGSKQRKLTPDFILRVHKEITKDTLEEKRFEGRYRDNDDVNVIERSTGEIVYHPPSHERVPKLIEDVCNFINNPSDYFVHPIIKASILHFLIGYIHPFEDGNGRTARSLFYWYLSKEGYWVIEFMSISRVIIKSPVKYAKAYLYTETDENDLTYFLKYQIKTMNYALRELKNYISEKIREEKNLSKIIEKVDGINMRQASIIYDFSKDERKKITIREVEETFDTVYETARKDLLELEKKGLLKRKVVGRKQIFFFRSQDFREKLSQLLKEN